jgi:hypothetical protein
LSLLPPSSVVAAVSDGFYRATGSYATFGFRVTHGRVAQAAPIARSWLAGQSWPEARHRLAMRGFSVSKLVEQRSREQILAEIREATRASDDPIWTP